MEKQISVWMLLVMLLICMIAPVQVLAAASNEDAYNLFDYNYFYSNQYGDYKYNIEFVNAPSHYLPVLFVQVNGTNCIYYVSLEAFLVSTNYQVHYSNDVFAKQTLNDISSVEHFVNSDTAVYIAKGPLKPVSQSPIYPLRSVVLDHV